MADNQQFDDLKKQAERLNRQLDNLGGAATKNIDDFIKSFGGGIDGAQKAIGNLRDQINGLDTDVNYLTDSLRKVTKELSNQNNFNKDIEKSYRRLSSLANQLYNDQNGLNTLSERELRNIKKKIELEGGSLKKILEDNIDNELNLLNSIEEKESIENKLLNILEKNGRLTKNQEKTYRDITNQLAEERKQLEKISAINNEAEDFLNGELKSFDLLVKAASDRLEYEKAINEKLGISGQLINGITNTLEKLGISSKFFENVKEDMRDAAEMAGSTKWSVFGAGIKSAWSGLKEGLKDPVTQLTLAKKAFDFFLNAAINANKESVNLSKNLGYGAANADRVRGNFSSIERSSGNLNVNTKNLSEAFNELSTTTGFVTEYSADALTTQIKLTKQLGLSGDEAAGVYKFSVLTGQSSESTYKSMLKGYVATRNSLNVGVPFKAAMAEAAKVSGQLASNLGNNPETIIKAVVATRALGTSLEQAKSQGESLLNFESSIDNELKAELITGQQLNLERARAAALMGDQVTVAEELAAQGMTAAKFSGMNVIAQKSYAEALGTTSDELANQLAKREMALASGKSLAQITAEEADEAARRQDVQTKFNVAMEKLQSIIGNLVAGPLGTMLEMLSGALEIINAMGPLLIGLATTFGVIKLSNMAIAAYTLVQKEGLVAQIAKIPALIGLESALAAIKTEGAIAAISGASALTLGVGAIAIIAGIAAAVGAMKSYSADDMVSPGYGKRTILSPEGAIQLNNNDTIVAGTNLGGDGEPESVKSTSNIDLTPMISAINQVTTAVNALNAKKWDVYLDSKVVGSGLMQNSYKSA
jgi:hypothetical protein